MRQLALGVVMAGSPFLLVLLNHHASAKLLEARPIAATSPVSSGQQRDLLDAYAEGEIAAPPSVAAPAGELRTVVPAALATVAQPAPVVEPPPPVVEAPAPPPVVEPPPLVAEPVAPVVEAPAPEPVAPEPAPEPEPAPAPAEAWIPSNAQEGIASWYDTTPGTCAHTAIAKGTTVEVTNLSSGATTSCTVNDSGPYVPGRVIDLSRTSFSEIADPSEGVVPVAVRW